MMCPLCKGFGMLVRRRWADGSPAQLVTCIDCGGSRVADLSDLAGAGIAEGGSSLEWRPRAASAVDTAWPFRDHRTQAEILDAEAAHA